MRSQIPAASSGIGSGVGVEIGVEIGVEVAPGAGAGVAGQDQRGGGAEQQATVFVHGRLRSGDHAVRDLLRLGAHVQVLAPVDLRALAAEATRIAALHADPWG